MPMRSINIDNKKVGLILAALILYLVLYVSKLDIWLISLVPRLQRHSLARYAFSFISAMAEADKLFLFAVVPSLLPIEFKDRKRFIIRTAFVIITSSILVGILKIAIGRPRPKMLTKGIYAPHPLHFNYRYYSTPSGHTTTSFAFFSYLTGCFKRYKVLFFATATLIGISRIMLLYHYPSDVILSATLGYVIGSSVRCDGKK